MNVGGRGKISCTPMRQDRVVWLISRGWSRDQAGDAVGISGEAITRQAARDASFRLRLDEAYERRRHRRPVAVHR